MPINRIYCKELYNDRKSLPVLLGGGSLIPFYWKKSGGGTAQQVVDIVPQWGMAGDMNLNWENAPACRLEVSIYLYTQTRYLDIALSQSSPTEIHAPLHCGTNPPLFEVNVLRTFMPSSFSFNVLYPSFQPQFQHFWVHPSRYRE